METSLFGTDGIRAPIGNYPLSHKVLPKLGSVLAQWAQKKYGTQLHLLLVHDTRISSSFIKSALKSGLFLHPLYLSDAGVLPTPAACIITRDHKHLNAGIIISASHNPYYDNGIKIVDATGTKLNHDDESIVASLLQEEKLQKIDYNALGSEVQLDDASQYYIDHLIHHFEPNFLRNIKIIVDCAHGATSAIAPKIFQHFGARVQSIHNKPNGININHQSGALFPQNLKKAVHKYHADIGFAFDGDGDRIIIVTQHGSIKNGDDILALLIDHPLYHHMPAIVGTIVTNLGLETFLQQRKKKLIRTHVGDKHVATQLKQNNLLLGGEQAGHIILCDYLNSSDGIFTALRVLETIINTKNYDMKTFVPYPQYATTIPVHIKKDLNTKPITDILEKNRSRLHEGRLIVRYSGTENVLRIMVEDKEQTHAELIGSQLAQALIKELSTF